MTEIYTIAKADDDGVTCPQDRQEVIRQLPPIVLALMQAAPDTYSDDIPDAPADDNQPGEDEK